MFAALLQIVFFWYQKFIGLNNDTEAEQNLYIDYKWDPSIYLYSCTLESGYVAYDYDES